MVGNTDLIRLVSLALRQNELSGIRELLRVAAELMESFGCILWELDSGANLDANPPSGRLYLLAQWFNADRIWAFDNLPLSSAAGWAVRTGEPVNIRDVQTDDRIDQRHPLLVEAGIRTECSVPLTLPGGQPGAVNFFRVESRGFSDGEITRAREIAELLPDLYGAIRNKVSFGLTVAINNDLHESPLERDRLPVPEAKVLETLDLIARRISAAFHCWETTILLEDRLVQPGLYQAVATTWKQEFPHHDYRADTSQGLTGWVLANALPVRILDLWHFHRDQTAYRDRYPGIVWKNFLGMSEAGFRKLRNLGEGRDLLPLSFLAVPVLLGKKVLGAIRCSAATTDPNYFSPHEEDQLKLIAARISSFWNEWLKLREIELENRSWLALVKSITDMNRVVAADETIKKPNETKLFRTALELMKTVIPEASLLDISLLDESRNHRLFVATIWEESKQKPLLDKNRLQLNDKAAWVVEKGQVLVVSDIGEDISAFPGVRSAILAPIKSGQTVFGILAARASSPQEFSLQATVVAELLGEQLGLYHSLFLTVGKLLKTEDQLKETVRRQSQTYEDFLHQLKGPLMQAYLRTHRVCQVKTITEDPRLRMTINAIRGLLQKAVRVANNMGLFVDLASGTPIRTRPTLLSADEVLRLLQEVASDTEATVGERNLVFKLRKGGFFALTAARVQADRRLLTQAVLNLLDNAVKYSYDNTVVEIYGGLTASDRFHISVANRGLRLTASDARKVAIRGWRSEDALYSTGEGSGIGLWIVDNIMRAHGGEMIVLPTNADGYVEVKLVFPRQE